MVEPWYCTREDVKSALDVKETARNHAQIDRLIGSSSRSIEQRMHRRKFYPTVAVRRIDYPTEYTNPNRRWRLWLDEHELISAATVMSGGVEIPAADYFLEPFNEGPPYTHVEIDLDSTAYFGHGTTHQREVVIDGVFGYTDATIGTGALAEALDDSETGVNVNASCSAGVGVGSIIKVDSERMIVTDRSMLSTGQTVLTTALTAQLNNQTILVTDGTAFAVGEILLIEAERMLIVDIAGNTLVVHRAWDGFAVAAHPVGATIYAPRTLTVERGALGTTAASHSDGAAVVAHWVPPLIRQLCIAETITGLQQEVSAYGRVVGSGDNQRESESPGLEDLRERAYQAHGRLVF